MLRHYSQAMIAWLRLRCQINFLSSANSGCRPRRARTTARKPKRNRRLGRNSCALQLVNALLAENENRELAA